MAKPVAHFAYFWQLLTCHPGCHHWMGAYMHPVPLPIANGEGMGSHIDSLATPLRATIIQHGWIICIITSHISIQGEE